MSGNKPIDVGIQCIWNESDLIRGWAKTNLYFCKRVYALLDPNTNDGTEEILRKEFPEINIIYQDLSLGDSNDYMGKGEKGIMITHINMNKYVHELVKEGEWFLYLSADERIHPKDWKTIKREIRNAKSEGKKALIHYTEHEFYTPTKCADLNLTNKTKILQYDKRWGYNAGSHQGRRWRYNKDEYFKSSVDLYHFFYTHPDKLNMWRYQNETCDWMRFGGPEGKFPMREYDGVPFDDWKELNDYDPMLKNPPMKPAKITESFKFIKDEIVLPAISIGNGEIDIKQLNPQIKTLDISDKYNPDIVEDFEKTIMVDSFKTVISINMLEHTKHPKKIIENAYKILKKEGLLLISVPFKADIHDFPNDYWRFTDQGLKLLCEEAGFKTEEIKKYLPGKDNNGEKIYYMGIFIKK